MSTERNLKVIRPKWLEADPLLSEPIFVGDYRNVELTAVGTGRIQVLGSKDIKMFDPLQPSSFNNSYVPVVLADETVATNNYSTTWILSNETKVGEVNVNVLGWISLSRNTETIRAFISVTDNQ